MKFNWTINRKIQMLIVIVLLVVYIVSNLALSQLIEENVRDSFSDNVMNTSLLLQNSTEVMFDDARNSLEFLKGIYEGKTRSNDLVDDYFSVLNETKDYIINTFIAYDDGEFLLVPDVTLPPDFDPRSRAWYKAAYESRDVKWSTPYIDIATGELVITGSVFIELENATGVLGVDIKLDTLPDIINKTKIGDNGFILLVSEDGTIITDSGQNFTNEKIDSLEDEEFLSSNIITGIIQTESGLYSLRRLNGTTIRLIAFLPQKDLLASAMEIQLISSLVLIFALIIGIVISYFLSKRITSPIERLTKTMIESSRKSNLILLDGSGTDETNTLIKGYNRLATHVNKQNHELKLISEDLLQSELKLQIQYEKVTELAYTDYLTGMPNRIKFEIETKKMISNNVKFALFYIDLDNFKNINDTYGHNHGDYVLKKISKRFVECCTGDYLGSRLSGDEFGIIITYDDKEEIVDTANRMLDLLNNPIHYNELEFTITGSIGICYFPESGETFEDLLSNADIAMYEAKSNLKNQYKIFNQELRANLVEKVHIESKLIHSIEKNELFVTYQPLIDFKTKKINGFESLVRWEEESLGLIYPDTFIPIAEHNLFINEIGYFVLEESLKFGNELHKKFGKYFEMSVNVSLVQLHLENFVESVIALIDKYEFPHEYLNLEITESVSLENDIGIQNKLSELKEKGIPISLDDFGTGYSSFNHLISLSLTHLKLDRSLISESTKKEEVRKLIQGLVTFAHAVNLKVVAEGIEDEYTEKMLFEMDIDYAQGYYYSKPVKDEAAIELIENNNRALFI